jgi:hypothetical protein
VNPYTKFGGLSFPHKYWKRVSDSNEPTGIYNAAELQINQLFLLTILAKIALFTQTSDLTRILLREIVKLNFGSQNVIKLQKYL